MVVLWYIRIEISYVPYAPDALCLFEEKKMKIKYESTIDEAVDAQFRLFRNSKIISKWKMEGLIFAPLIFAIFYFGLPDTKTVKLIFAIGSSLLFIAIYLGIYKTIFRKRVKKLLIEQLGTDKPMSCEYELDDTGLVFRRVGMELKFQWSNLTEINDSVGEVELIFGKMGIAIIPKRIFESEYQKNEWLRYINENNNILTNHNTGQNINQNKT